MTTAEQRHTDGACVPQICRYCWWDDMEPADDQAERNEDAQEQADWDAWRERS